MYPLITLATLLLLTFLNYKIARSVLYPPFIFSAIWVLPITIYAAGFIPTDSIRPATFYLICLGDLFFSLGGAAAMLIPQFIVSIRFRKWRFSQHTYWVKFLFLVFGIFNCLLLLKHTISLSAFGIGPTFLSRARAAGVELAMEMNQGNAKDSISYFGFIPSWSIFTTALFQIERKDFYFYTSAAVTFISCILTTGRTSLFLMFTSIAAIGLLRSNRITLTSSWRILRWPTGLLLFLFCLLIFTNKQGLEESDSVIHIVSFSILSYIVGPTVALDKVLYNPSDFALTTNHTFKFFYKVASLFLKTNYTPPPLIDQFVYVPFPTNVYTVYKFYFLDFGFIGCICLIAIIGFIHTVLYRRALAINAFAIFCFSLSMYSILMVFFDDAYLLFGTITNATVFYTIYMLMRHYSVRFCAHDASLVSINENEECKTCFEKMKDLI
jgi:oligosaccharide repeat unit polymerase